MFVISAPIQIIAGSVAVCPILIWHDIVYIPSDHYCFTVFTQIRGILWLLCTCYGLPVIFLVIIYIRITLFIRNQSNNLALALKRRQQRDLLAIRRIFINVGLLLAVGIPVMVVILMALITGVEHPLSHRITWIGGEVSFALLSIEMIFTTPQLKNIVIRKTNQNRVIIIEDSIQIRLVTTAY
jgi:hypothetical protein